MRHERRGDACVHPILEALVADCPDAIALVDDAAHLSYAELNRRAQSVFLLDSGSTRVPVRAMGELYVAGPALRRGHVDSPQLTACTLVSGSTRQDARRADSWTGR